MQDIGPLAQGPGHFGRPVKFFLGKPESFQGVSEDEREGGLWLSQAAFPHCSCLQECNPHGFGFLVCGELACMQPQLDPIYRQAADLSGGS